MEKQITVWFGAGLLLAGLNFSQAQVIPTYFEVGGKLDLRPTVTETITNILWKFNGNVLAEWVKDQVELFYYEKYKDRTTLNTTTGKLVIGKMGKDDAGVYTVEINNKVHGQSYNAKWITRVTKPTVVFRPLTCGNESESCSVTCDGKEPESLTDAEPIDYSWKIGEKDWKMMKKDITITSAETETESIREISCRMKNPVSQEDSEPKVNPLFKLKPEVWKVHLRLSLHAVFWVFVGCVLLIPIGRLIRQRQDKNSSTT
ncbi:SLAM family member 7-like [Acanthopagrus latus]|uniref:SLAM family member 7-like n=1 Tax=Acanthopagrus latus TaxID=8177 RepID=UPI00187C0C83|nr:SLAM family member 7-like [Acanthopagrus latus]